MAAHRTSQSATAQSSTPTTRTIGEPIEWDWYFVKRRHLPIARRGLSIALGVLAVILPLQGFIGDSVVAYVAKYKTPQFEAQEGNWRPNTGYNIFEIPNQAGRSNDWRVSIPWLGSAISKEPRDTLSRDLFRG